MKKRTQFKRASIIALCATLIAVIVINVVSAYISGKADLTEYKRFTLSQSTIDLLESTDDDVYVKFYLHGDNVPEEYVPLIERAKEMLAEFKDVSSNVHYEFIDPLAGKKPEEMQAILGQFLDKGLYPTPVNSKYNAGQQVTMQYIIPGATISYKNREHSVLLVENDMRGYYPTIDYSYMRMEYNFARTLKALIQPKKSHVAVIQGHGELATPNVMWTIGQLGEGMEDFYSVDIATIAGRINSLRNTTYADNDSTQIKYLGNKYDLLIVPQPTQWVSDTDRYIIDQHIMHGGRVLWLIDATNASMDSVENVQAMYAIQNPGYQSLQKLFFNYGVRINPDMLMDMESFQMVNVHGKNQSFPYLLNLTNFNEHPITQHIESVRANFASSIDSVNSGDGLKKTVLATTSKKTKIKTAPGFVALKEGRDRPNVAEYNHKNVPVAMLVEGKFRSAFAGRLPIALTTDHQFDHKDYSPDTKQIFISDGDMIRNFVDSAAWFPAVMMYQNPNVQRQFKMHEWLLVQKAIFPTGYDQNTGKMYDNTEFLVNCVDYLCDNSDMIELRSKILQIGQLDKSKTGVEKVKLRYQLLNLGLPLLLLVLTGAIAMVVRRLRYSRAR